MEQKPERERGWIGGMGRHLPWAMVALVVAAVLYWYFLDRATGQEFIVPDCCVM